MDNFFDSVDIDEINKASKQKQRETLNNIYDGYDLRKPDFDSAE